MISFRMLRWSAIALASCVLLPSTSSAAIITFDDRGAFEAAVSGFALTQDSFDNPIPAALQITLDSGIVSTNASPSVLAGDNSVVLNGLYENSVSTFADISDSVTWDFPTSVIGFGFDLFRAATGRLQVTLDGGDGPETFFFTDINSDTTDSGFVGFLVDSALQSIVFSNPFSSTDTFRIDDLVFAEAPGTAAVPAPTTLPLTLSAIGMLLFTARRRTAASRITPGTGKTT